MSFAQLDFNGNTPTSIEFDDIYFSPSDGVGESLYHFIEGNRLPSRFPHVITEPETEIFTIGEMGFGTGLNFLLTAELWVRCLKQNSTSKASTLHYISVEKYPITASQLKHIYQTQGWDNDIAQQLLANYPSHSSVNQHEVSFTLGNSQQKILLTLLISDAYKALKQYKINADAWYLDGFAPSKNPDMWSDKLIQLIAAYSHHGTTFATFTAASAVRKRLIEVGFDVKKTKGFGKKRERLIGSYSS